MFMAKEFHVPLETALYLVKTVTRLLIMLPLIFTVFKELKILRKLGRPQSTFLASNTSQTRYLRNIKHSLTEWSPPRLDSGEPKTANGKLQKYHLNRVFNLAHPLDTSAVMKPITSRSRGQTGAMLLCFIPRIQCTALLVTSVAHAHIVQSGGRGCRNCFWRNFTVAKTRLLTAASAIDYDS